MSEICTDCGCKIATQLDYEESNPEDREDLCWRTWSNNICEKEPIDWCTESKRMTKVFEELLVDRFALTELRDWWRQRFYGKETK